METQDEKGRSVSGRVLGIVGAPLFLIAVAALAVRLVLMPLFTYDFDIYHWGVVIQNIDSGNNLYNIAGYYYTPVWGYILGALSSVQHVFGPDMFGARFTDLLPIEDLAISWHTATTVTTGFVVFMKIPLILCDMAVAYLLHWIVMDRTGDKKKSMMAVGLWLFCPTVIYMSGVQAQFDTISALFMLLMAIAIYKDRCFLGGMLFSAAFLLKFFPGFCFFVIIAYILVRHRGDGLAKRKLAFAILGGALMAAVILIPQILTGTVMDTLSFMTGRMETYSSIWMSIAGYAAMVIAVSGAMYFGYRMYRSEEKDADRQFFTYLFLALTMAMFLSIAPQYMIVMLPLLIFGAVVRDRRLMVPLVIIAIGSFFAALSLNNLSLLASASEFLGLASPEWIISGMQMLEVRILGITLVEWMNLIANIVEYAGLVMIVVLHFEKQIVSARPSLGRLMIKLYGGREVVE
ncbi:MAG: hypothetical protein LBT41_03245 [Candidatus Methanoplasma sp.]|jgi:hypothetical protein|nr:hypothetical protein [Candidatus Methanoplasma sp.]